MKKILALVLSLSFVLGGAVFAAEDTQQNEYEYEIELLDDLGILKAKDAGVEDAYQILTRGQFISALMAVARPKYVSETRYNPFDDLDKDDFGYQAILDAYTLKILKTEANEIKPNDGITLTEAAQTVVSALGYDRVITDAGYYAKAQELKLLRGMRAGIDDELTYADAAKLFANAIETPVCEYTPKGQQGSYSVEINKDYTLMNKEFDIYKTEGVLSENCLTSVYETKEYRQAHIKVGDIEGKIYNTNLALDYIGMYADAYYRVTDNDENIFLHLRADDNKNNIDVIDAADVLNFSGRVLRFGKNGRTDTADIPVSASVIYNGKLKAQYDENIFYIPEGRIVVIDNNMDKKADVVTVTSYKNMIVEGVNLSDKEIFGKNTSVKLDEDTSDVISVITDTEGKAVSIESISAKDVLTYTESEDKKYIRIKISKETVSGKVYSTEKETRSYGEKEYTDAKADIDGTIYSVSPSFADFDSQIKSGTEADFYINANGMIVGLDTNVNAKRYGFIIKIYDGQADENIVYVKIINGYGAIKKYKLADKYRIDSKKTMKNNVQPFLTQISEHRMIMFKLNASGEITDIDTWQDRSDGSGTLRSIYGNTVISAMLINNRNFNGLMPVHDETVIMIVPSNINDWDESHYMVASRTMSYRFNDSTIQGFTTKDEGYEPEVILLSTNLTKTKGTMTGYGMRFVVGGTYKGLNEDNEIVDGLTLYGTDGVKKKALCKDTSVMSGLSLNKGDIVLVRFDTGYNGEDVLCQVERAYDVKNHVLGTTTLPDWKNNYQSTTRAKAGRLVWADDRNLVISDTGDDSVVTDWKQFENSRLPSATPVILVDKSDRETAQVKDINYLKLAAKTHEKVFVIYANDAPSVIFIIK